MRKKYTESLQTKEKNILKETIDERNNRLKKVYPVMFML